ncbi:hypothetical protein GWI33_014514 [Rhynchophorus ferrugineus]|uniref:Uncharacterized protein n=1 Tax=Rhynchophorus ferrugineus TaxID=354439 RepID=A0A834M5F0_RHYFE|nr:hypothetical protein GWI33_014514 [Rhynchophorus ferrugineus]
MSRSHLEKVHRQAGGLLLATLMSYRLPSQSLFRLAKRRRGPTTEPAPLPSSPQDSPGLFSTLSRLFSPRSALVPHSARVRTPNGNLIANFDYGAFLLVFFFTLSRIPNMTLIRGELLEVIWV